MFLCIAVLLIAVPAAAQRWEELGRRDVTDRVDHDTIVVTAIRGAFNGVKITAQQSPVRFFRVVVHFGNGRQQELEMRDVIPAGGETRVINLCGDDRVIKSVDLWYEAKNLGRRGAVVRLFGRR